MTLLYPSSASCLTVVQTTDQYSNATTFTQTVNDNTLHYFIKSAFCLKTSYFMNKKNPTGGNFASGAVWHTIVFKVSAFHFLGPKTDCRDDLVENLSSILITIIDTKR